MQKFPWKYMGIILTTAILNYSSVKVNFFPLLLSGVLSGIQGSLKSTCIAYLQSLKY